VGRKSAFSALKSASRRILQRPGYHGGTQDDQATEVDIHRGGGEVKSSLTLALAWLPIAYFIGALITASIIADTDIDTVGHFKVGTLMFGTVIYGLGVLAHTLIKESPDA
jgi:hypothetical protein